MPEQESWLSYLETFSNKVPSPSKPLIGCKLTICNPSVFLLTRTTLPSCSHSHFEKLHKTLLKVLLMKYRNLPINISFQSSPRNLHKQGIQRLQSNSPSWPWRKFFNSEDKGETLGLRSAEVWKWSGSTRQFLVLDNFTILSRNLQSGGVNLKVWETWVLKSFKENTLSWFSKARVTPILIFFFFFAIMQLTWPSLRQKTSEVSMNSKERTTLMGIYCLLQEGCQFSGVLVSFVSFLLDVNVWNVEVVGTTGSYNSQRRHKVNILMGTEASKKLVADSGIWNQDDRVRAHWSMKGSIP